MKRILTHNDRHLFHEGTHARAYLKLGAHPGRHKGKSGCWISTWAPAAERVDVIGDWNGWSGGATPLTRVSDGGLWQGFARGAAEGHCYKLRIHRDDAHHDKADPWAARTEVPPRTASVVWKDRYAWSDQAWMGERSERNARSAPMSIYEVHPGSWKRENGQPLGWLDLAEPLIEHVQRLGFTHVELMPVMEHPFYGSWGYQVSGYHAPTSRYGPPDHLQALIDQLHQAQIGVILDWVPAHFPADDFALAQFDGGPLFEHTDPQRRHHPDWKTLIFDYGRPEVRSFLLSSALCWLDRFHADGLRFDAVASMLYRDYSREDGGWTPNERGGNEDLEAEAFLKQVNATIYGLHPDVQTFAEESTAWPGVSHPVHSGGLGFGFKWDMGWMHDTLGYLAEDPIHRQHHHNRLTFRTVYAGSENFVLPLSHDEVVHGKGSLLNKMPGDPWQQRANTRLLLVWQHATPGKKLLFMGQEWAQSNEWTHEGELRWDEYLNPEHGGIAALVATLNRLHRSEPALHAGDHEADGFQWIDGSDARNGVVAFLRKDPTSGSAIACIHHFTPSVLVDYRIGLPDADAWEPVLQSDDLAYGGSGVVMAGPITPESVPHHGFGGSVVVTLPPLGALWLRPVQRP
ncbi:MAG: 1,4-alpha-glucan branching protein GlgB [Myxococcota bacterium]